MIKYGTLIGEGGEAKVYKHKDKAIKIFKEDKSDKVAKELCGLKLERIVTPIELIYEDDKFIGYIMDYIDSISNVTNITKGDLLDSLLLIKKDLNVLSKKGIIARDLIPRNSILTEEGLYFIDTSLYSICNSDYITNIRINNQLLHGYIKSLVGYSSGSLINRKYLDSIIDDYYAVITSDMNDDETLNVFAKRLIKEKQL